MERDELIGSLEALRPEFAKLLRQFGAHEPDWEPLESVLVHGFMFMGYCEGRRMYKHRLTRNYLHLDADGRAYRWEQDHYQAIPVEEAIADAFEGLEDMAGSTDDWKGLVHLKDGDWSNTKHPFIPQLLARAKTLQGREKARALMGLAEALWEEDSFVAALSAIDEARSISAELGNWAEVAECDQSAAIYLRDDAIYGAAFERADAAHKIWIGLGNLREAAECDCIAGGLLARLGRSEEAIAKFENAKAVFLEVGSYDDAKLCDALRAEIMPGPQDEP